jgi:hypothetical protein
MQADCDGVEIVVEQVGIGVERDLRGLVFDMRVICGGSTTRAWVG